MDDSFCSSEKHSNLYCFVYLELQIVFAAPIHKFILSDHDIQTRMSLY